MSWVDYVLLISMAVILSFALVLLVGAPYVPTLPKQKSAAIAAALADAKSPLLYELGSGDGTVMLAAAKLGVRSVGYELNPIMWAISYARLWRYRTLADVRFGDFWTKNIADADVIFVFLHPRFMKKLDKKITQEARKKIKLISFAFEVPGKKPDATTDGLFIYIYKPAKKQTT